MRGRKGYIMTLTLPRTHIREARSRPAHRVAALPPSRRRQLFQRVTILLRQALQVSVARHLAQHVFCQQSALGQPQHRRLPGLALLPPALGFAVCRLALPRAQQRVADLVGCVGV